MTIRGTYPSAIPRMGRRLSHVDIGGISDLTVWLSSAWGVVRDSSGNVEQWRDRSGRGNHAVQATAAARPTYARDASGRWAVQTSATPRYLTIPQTTDTDPTARGLTVYIAASTSDAAASATLVSKWNAANPAIKSWTILANDGLNSNSGAYMCEAGTLTLRRVLMSNNFSDGNRRAWCLRYNAAVPEIRATQGATAFGPTAIAGAAVVSVETTIGALDATGSTPVAANLYELVIIQRHVPHNSVDDIAVRNYLAQQQAAA